MGCVNCEFASWLNAVLLFLLLLVPVSPSLLRSWQPKGGLCSCSKLGQRGLHADFFFFT